MQKAFHKEIYVNKNEGNKGMDNNRVYCTLYAVHLYKKGYRFVWKIPLGLQLIHSCKRLQTMIGRIQTLGLHFFKKCNLIYFS